MRASVLALAVLVLGQDPDIDSLLNRVSEESIEERTRAVKALMDYGTKAESKVRAKLETSQGETRLLCERILAHYERRKRIDSVLPPLKRVSIRATDRPLKEVLKELQSQSGVPLEFADLQDRNISVQAIEATVLEAVTAVCKAGDLSYEIGLGRPSKPGEPSPRKDAAIWLKADGYADAPRKFERHFAVECLRITLERRTRFDAPATSGRLSVRVRWPPGVRVEHALLDIASVEDDRGGRLYEKRSYDRYGQSNVGFPGQVFFSAEGGVDFKYPADGVERVTVRGSVLVLFAGEDRYITFENPARSQGQKKELADMSVELVGFKEEAGGAVVTIAFKGRPKNPMTEGRVAMGGLGSRFYKVRLEDGTTVDCRSTSGRGAGALQIMDLNFPGLPSKIAAVDVLAETIYHEERFDFEFKDIPLPK
jgi:hypothetical protein